MALIPAPEGDVIEIDEICVRLTPSLWLWIAISRQTGQVLGFALGQRDRASLALCWSDVPEDYQDLPVFTDGYGAYAGFFPPWQHHPSEKGSGGTSRAESLNTKWRQRQSGLVRRACGTAWRIAEDLTERFFLLVEQHNQHCQRRWNRRQAQAITHPGQ